VVVGDAHCVADRVCLLGYRDVDLFCDLYGVIYLDAEIANGAFVFRVPESKLNRSEVHSPPIDQHRHGRSYPGRQVLLGGTHSFGPRRACLSIG
jgi:hypothetical protein